MSTVDEVVVLVPSSLDVVKVAETLRRSTDRPLRVVSLDDYGTTEVAIRVETVARTYGLTSRERDVLPAIIRGQSNEDIAKRLGISLRTTKCHVEHLLRRTGAASRHELMGLVAFGIAGTRPR